MVAVKEFPLTRWTGVADEESSLTLIGYIAFSSIRPAKPPRRPLAALARHGVTVKILTGDNEVVTAKVCHDVGLPPGQVLRFGREALDDRELAARAETTTVFAKLTPAHKDASVRLPRGQRACGRVHGRRHHDAAALHVADIGISVDTAVDIAKEAADIILLEKTCWCSTRRAGRQAPSSTC